MAATIELMKNQPELFNGRKGTKSDIAKELMLLMQCLISSFNDQTFSSKFIAQLDKLLNHLHILENLDSVNEEIQASNLVADIKNMQFLS